MASVTLWTRLEPHPRDGSMARSLQAQVRDPLWMLARQWQLGELAGEDAGSPAQAVMSVQSQPLTGYAPDGTGAGQVPYDPGVPLEPHVERVPVTLNVRGSARLGAHAEAAIRAAVAHATAGTVIAALRAAYPIAATVAADAPEDAAGRAVRASLAGRVVDGVALAAAAAVAQAGGTPVPPLPPEASLPGIPPVLAGLVAYRASLYSEPAGDAAWQSRRLSYAATVSSAASTGTVTLTAPDFRGGDLDWYSFSLAAAGNPAAPATSRVPTSRVAPRREAARRPPPPSAHSASCPTTSPSAACQPRAGGSSRTRSPTSARSSPARSIWPPCWSWSSPWSSATTGSTCRCRPMSAPCPR